MRANRLLRACAFTAAAVAAIGGCATPSNHKRAPASEAQISPEIPTNLWIGTGGSVTALGDTFPGASVPFGMVRLSPDTKFGSFEIDSLGNLFELGTAGYNYNHDRVIGFSHTRLSGTGVREGGLFRVRPLTNDGDFEKRTGDLPLKHDQEHAVPGRYELDFPDDGIRAELTSSMHCGFHRYTLTDSKRTLHLILDGASTLSGDEKGTGYGSAKNAELSVNPAANSISGSVILRTTFSARYGGLPAYFYAEYSPGIESVQLWNGKNWQNTPSLSGEDVSAGLTVGKSTSVAELKLCISYISAANAQENFVAEARDHDFDTVSAQAATAWTEILSRAQITASIPDVAPIFYTALYHALLMPTQFTDTNGEYRGFDGKTHSSSGFTYRTDMSLWDIFRTTGPLYTLIAPEIERDIVRSLLEMGKINGLVPRWPAGAGESGSMFGSPANFFFSEAYLKGIRDFDTSAALSFMVKAGTEAPPKGVSGRELVCAQDGYCPTDLVPSDSVSKTLEYAWADQATANLAGALGEKAIQEQFSQKALNYRNVWDPSTQFFRPKNSKGAWQQFSPDLTSYIGFLGSNAGAYAEGSPQQWRFSAPHQAQDLVRLYGGGENFSKILDDFMRGATPKRSALYPGAKYWQGNEPDIHALYLFNEAGHPELTQKWARWALASRYGNAADGLDGNDDAGAISAWYVLSALGLYPQAGSDQYWLGSPAVDSAILDLGSGRKLTILAHEQGPENIYVQRVLLNGEPWCKPSITQAQLINARLEFFMGPSSAPNGGYACAQSQ